MPLIFSNLLRKKILYSLFFLSALSVFQTKPEVSDFSYVSFAKQASFNVLRLIVFLGVIYAIGYVFKHSLQQKSPTNENALQTLNVREDEQFFGELSGGFQDIFDYIVGSCAITDPKERAEFFKNSHSNFIFYSSPGCGKNHSIKYLQYKLKQAKLDIPFYFSQNVETSFVGGGSLTLDKIFKNLAQAAKRSPNKIAVVIFDEFDTVASERSYSLGPNQTTNCLLSLLDGFEPQTNNNDQIKIILIGLTNNIKFIDGGMISRSEQFKFKLSKENLFQIMRSKFGADFFDTCSILAECVKGKYFFEKTQKRINARDVGSIKKTIFTACCKRRRATGEKKPYISFDKIPLDERVEVFNEKFGLKKVTHTKQNSNKIVKTTETMMLYQIKQ